MAKYLYADNFRGFSDTYVPLLDVNFLVGENSTGKTSVLDLLRTFHNPGLWFGQTPFGTQEVQLGHFKEVVSAHSDDQSYFRIGFVDDGPPITSALLITYKEKAGLPKLSRFTYAMGEKAVALRFDGPRLYALISALEKNNDTRSLRQLMPHWVALHSDETAQWSEVKPPSDMPNWSWSRTPLFILTSLLTQSIAAQEAKEDTEKEAGTTPDVTPFSLPPLMGSNLVWIGPIRTRARRTYDAPNTSFSPSGLHTPYVIRRMLESSEEAAKFTDFMDRVGKASHLFESIKIRPFGDANDPTVPFEVDAVLDEKALNLSWMGYGVSQSLPIFVELLDRPKGTWFAIQQPEVHLHPRAQASLGDVFFEMAARDNKRFVVETHSDFTIDRFRMNYRKKVSQKPTGQILFFERHRKRNVLTPLPIGQDGDLPSEQPRGYRDFFVKEEMRLLGI
jgi:hypothetical protein